MTRGEVALYAAGAWLALFILAVLVMLAYDRLRRPDTLDENDARVHARPHGNADLVEDDAGWWDHADRAPSEPTT